jgi:hypothetical protein
MGKQPKKQHVKDHLRKRRIDPATLPDDVIDALDEFSKEELDKVDDLGTALTDAEIDCDLKVSAVH